ncbi:CaiB/BaiF CoA-transferase family protein [Erwinia sp. B116]|uniref:CaiB/BaiF CoA transferase family protein n=1 Tax=Erwinia sp. B116 TaxID=1561024 RepID=UPI000C7713D3|nr:CoA transferase [Erwinia sp. B116]PLV61249.1 hypothetical protein NV64_10290 [Erwinia sp. B116]
MSVSPSPLFSGLKVLDIATFIAGPAAATILSDFGADVIKVESPSGDPDRVLSQNPNMPASDYNYAWQLTNRNKRSLILDLKSPEAREVLVPLIEWADVVVTNYLPEIRERLGLTWPGVHAINPWAIYADITGYGAQGPDANEPGFDSCAWWARSGLMNTLRNADAEPVMTLPACGDHVSATALYAAIVTGLLMREKNGEGMQVSTSLIANGIWTAAEYVEGALNQATPARQADRKDPVNALSNCYRTVDDRWLVVSAFQRKDWQKLLVALDAEQLGSDERFADVASRIRHTRALAAEFTRRFAQKTLHQWRTILTRHRIIFGIVQTFPEVVSDPQLHLNACLLPYHDRQGRERLTVSSPFTLSGVNKVTPRPAPEFGEHTDAILQSLGFTAQRIDRLKKNGVII